MFVVAAPLCLVRRIEAFAFSFLIADVLIVGTAICIVVYGILHVQERGEWGKGVVMFN
jgi:hypothetical protein